jgi:hypothetical protein
MRKTVHWHDGVKDMSFEDFKEFHKNLFVDDEMKEAYQEATGRDPDAKPKSRKKQADDNEGESV